MLTFPRRPFAGDDVYYSAYYPVCQGLFSYFMNTEIGFLLLILVYKDDIFCVIIFLEE